MRTFIESLPKVELHCHIEGTFEPELIFELAQRNGVSLSYGTVEEIRQAYEFTQLQDFLDIYYQGMSVLLKEQDFYDLTWAYIERIHQQNVRHTEIFFDPRAFAEGVEFGVIVDGIHRALEDAKDQYGITSELIMCFLRHLDEDSALQTLEAASPYRDKIIGVGLDSSELGHPPSKFKNVFRKAKDAGYKCVAHAGEEGPAEYVREALDLLSVDRIDHGNNAMDDDLLVTRLVEEKMPLTVCPLSNTRLCVVDDMREHPIRTMLEKGLHVTVNSDDPAYFGGYMNENFIAITEALALKKEQIALLARNAIDASFASNVRKQALLTELDQYLAGA